MSLPNWDTAQKNWKKDQVRKMAKKVKNELLGKIVASRLLTPLLFLTIQHLTKLTLFTR